MNNNLLFFSQDRLFVFVFSVEGLDMRQNNIYDVSVFCSMCSAQWYNAFEWMHVERLQNPDVAQTDETLFKYSFIGLVIRQSIWWLL